LLHIRADFAARFAVDGRFGIFNLPMFRAGQAGIETPAFEPALHGIKFATAQNFTDDLLHRGFAATAFAEHGHQVPLNERAL
jgi:hypothetical protein